MLQRRKSHCFLSRSLSVPPVLCMEVRKGNVFLPTLAPGGGDKAPAGHYSDLACVLLIKTRDVGM